MASLGVAWARLFVPLGCLLGLKISLLPGPGFPRGHPPAATGCSWGLKTLIKPDFQPKGRLRPPKSLQKRPKKPQRQPKRGQERPRDGPRESQEPPADKNTVKITCQKVFRDRCRPDAQRTCARWPVWGAHAPTGPGQHGNGKRGKKKKRKRGTDGMAGALLVMCLLVLCCCV